MIKNKRLPNVTGLGAMLLLGAVLASFGAEPRHFLKHQVPAVVARLTPQGLLPATNQLHLAISLPLRNEDALNQLLREIYDPASTNYHHYLTPEQFTKQFGPTEPDYQAVINFARTNGLTVTATHANRALMDVSGSAATVEKAFQMTLHVYRHPTENRNFFAPDSAPSTDAGIPISHVSGLDNFIIPRPAIIKTSRSAAIASAAAPAAGSGPNGEYMGKDFRAAYVPGTPLNGAGQMVGLLELDGYYASDIVSYENQAGLPQVTLTNVLVDNYSGAAGGNNSEVALDIEMAVSMATNLSAVIVYEAQNNGSTPADVLNRIATDNLAKQISSSWLLGDNSSYDTYYKQMAAQGQSFFQASGDDGAYYTANENTEQNTDDTNITLVGGTTLFTAGPAGAWSSETVWNWYSTAEGTGVSGGGTNYNGIRIPIWQQGVNMATNQGSTALRNVPDVALTADNIYVVYNNGNFNNNEFFGGTSCAAPLWAGFTALVNQQAAIAGEPPVGFLNPALYAIGKGANYTLNFHDITAGNNTNATVHNRYFAEAGYDLCTGWGTPNGINLINTLAPPAYFTAMTNAGWALLAESGTPADGAIDPGETVTVNFTLQNQGTLAPGNLVATLRPNAGVLAPGGPQTYGAVAGYGGSVSRTFTFTAAGMCGSNFVAMLQLQDGTNNLGTVNFTLPLGGVVTNSVQSFAQNFDGVTAPALPAGWTTANITGTANSWVAVTASSDTSPNSVFISDIASTSENALVSPVISIASANAQLSLRHNYSFEYSTGRHSTTYHDGGVLEIKIGGGTFTDILSAGGSFVTGGYNTKINSSSNPLSGRSAWVNSSGGWQTVLVNLPATAAGQNIQLRWNCGTDSSNSGTGAAGWFVDTISIADGVTSTNCSPVFTDLAASQSLAPSSLNAGQNLIYTLTVTNLGTQAAANVMVTSTVPANVSFVSASPGYGYSAGRVVWPAGMLPAAAATNFTLTLAPAGGNVFTNLVSVGTVTPEISTANNTATLVSTQAVVALPPVISGVAANPDGSFTLQLAGSPGSPYILEATTNLFPPGNWVPIATNTLGLDGLWQFTDTSATNFPQQFYRLESSP